MDAADPLKSGGSDAQAAERSATASSSSGIPFFIFYEMLLAVSEVTPVGSYTLISYALCSEN